ncbi:MAG TPA: hypothetical protein VNW97_12520 [Candidatus Saccharimonadales bacterium]|jgi:hypothetical protein|nr:hypothetical protein [Candidatus Saccharimonadales bacterium]
MSEVGGLFAVFLLIYLAQCLWWTPPGASVFALGTRGKGARKEQGFVWNAFDLAGVLASPLPPLPPLVVSEWPAFQPEPDRFCHCPSAGAEPVPIPWESLVVTSSDSRLLCNGVSVLKAGEAQIQRYAEFLRQTAKLNRRGRERAIETWLLRSTDQKAASQELEDFRRRSRWLRIITNVEFFLLFLIVPLAFRSLGTRALWPAVSALAAVAISITLEFWMLHRALFPESSAARMKSAVTILLSPVAAVRACDAVSKELLTGFHPLAVASVILPEDEFKHFASEQLRACRYGPASGGWYGAKLQKALEGLVRQQGMQPGPLMSPSKQETNCVAYCPRCLAQYVNDRAECADCGYQELVGFSGKKDWSADRPN